MMLLTRVLVILVATASVALAQKGIDVSVRVSSTTARCLAREYEFAIVRCYHSSARVDTNCAGSVAALRRAGFGAVDAYMFITSLRKTPQQQMNEMAQYLRSNNVRVGRVWLDIEQARPYWSRSPASNERFIRGLITAGQRLGLKLGVYSNVVQWRAIVGHTGAGPWSALPLWYPRYLRSNSVSMASFRPFGGWTRPLAHQYSERGQGCGIGFDINYSPNFDSLSVAPSTPRSPTSSTPNGIHTTCSVPGLGGGTCHLTSACNGESSPGFCPGPNQVQCCTPEPQQVAPEGEGASCSVGRSSGICKLTAHCTGADTSTPNLCPGPRNVQCCTSSQQPRAPRATPAPRPIPTPAPRPVARPTPAPRPAPRPVARPVARPTPAPPLRGVGLPCSTEDGREGDCQLTSTCGEESVPGFCDGPNQVQCCTEPLPPAPAVPPPRVPPSSNPFRNFFGRFAF